ncbi:MAG: hypothetical protein IPH62_12355 [Ignavibacteriae bacterium]|nr:hypothetical protein [Ignavibacteriota bacterium]
MKKLTFIFLVFISSLSFAQFKGEESKPIDIRSGILSENPISSLFSFINPENFSMNHSFGISYSSFGNNGLALGVYTNHLAYKFSEEFDFELDASLVNSPYNTLGDSFTKSINGFYIDNARINYNPSKDFNISLMFSNSPYGYYNSYGYGRLSPYSNRWFD